MTVLIVYNRSFCGITSLESLGANVAKNCKIVDFCSSFSLEDTFKKSAWQIGRFSAGIKTT